MLNRDDESGNISTGDEDEQDDEWTRKGEIVAVMVVVSLVMRLVDVQSSLADYTSNYICFFFVFSFSFYEFIFYFSVSFQKRTVH